MNFFKKFEKLKVKYKTNKKRILSITVTAVGIACLLIGSSMAYLLFEASGTTQTISAGTLQLSYTNESEAIILNNAVPQSDEQGLNNNVYSITLTNTSTIKSYYELSLNNNCTVGNSYTVNGSSVTANVCIPNNYLKVAVKTNKDEDYTIKNGGNVILKGYLEAKENISFEMIIWLTEETPNDYQGQTETGTPRNVIYNGNFKIYTRQMLDSEKPIDESGANKPVLASNMIPVYYDETNSVWKKSDVSNMDKTNPWYSYNSTGEYKGMWANAVTVTGTNRQTYLNATPGTVIPMDSEFTRKFQVVQDRNEEMRATLMAVYDALKEKGYNPINQIVGYILSEDPTYITNYNNARTLIRKLDRDELLQELVRQYLTS